MIFVFGSNYAGAHGAGAARAACLYRKFPYGAGEGYAKGCYAIPTKDIHIDTLPMEVIQRNVKSFLNFADELFTVEGAWGATEEVEDNGFTKFQVTRIGCGLAGLKDEAIAPLFKNATPNCWFDEEWRPFLGPDRKYWGTF